MSDGISALETNSVGQEADSKPLPALGREAILSLIGKDRTAEFVDCRPHWNGGVWLRVMTGEERDGFEFRMSRAVGDAEGMKNYRAKTLVNCLCDESGQLLFRQGDEAQLGQLNSLVLVKLWDECSRINGLTEKAAEAALSKSPQAAG